MALSINKAAALAFACATLFQGSAVAAEGGQRMTREVYAAYLAAFNAGDDRYAEIYAPDVVFDHGPYGVLRGRQAILDFYRDIRTQLKERVTASEVVIGEDQKVMAVELTTELTAVRDGVKLPSRTEPLKKGETLITRGVVFYGLSDGRVVTIRGAVRGVTFVPAKP